MDADADADATQQEAPDKVEQWVDRVLSMAQTAGMENAANVLRFAAAVALEDLSGAVADAADRFATEGVEVERARVEGQLEAEMALIAAEGKRLADAERTRRLILLAMVLVSSGAVAAGVFTGKLVEAAALMAAFGVLVKLLVGDEVPTSLGEIAENGPK